VKDEKPLDSFADVPSDFNRAISNNKARAARLALPEQPASSWYGLFFGNAGHNVQISVRKAYECPASPK
jgi:hypothetical protein